LLYYPGSHKLPFIDNKHYNHGNTKWKINVAHYQRYEDKIREVVAEKKLQAGTFAAKKGDILIWHANLLHGGNKIKNKKATRQSLVMHYYCKDVLCYCERAEKLALLARLKKHFSC
jgi:ectoine hydroxylase-related dioxygenase (phytanoyl-CoA dioxygenase family)